MRNGVARQSDSLYVELENVTFMNLTDSTDGAAAVVMQRHDDNGTNFMLYVFDSPPGKITLLGSAEFGLENDKLGTVFSAHGELVIIRAVMASDDSYCCPSIFEMRSFRWQKDKFVEAHSPEQFPNPYVKDIKAKQKQTN